ncbi:hypothetical protein PRIPAC_93755 [Pristionchus pacificus]|uniref:Uncharacterized protein n=1 Tax=Pristionchus pacificus TaxID=54126 RepID=A0A2A6BNZ5_PRIPA|nr:hypothetical protein PRIPAC_93755 [Pristionchus pacificus]|eukprot:PDM67645.1 hypothetical protein PRIPAC_45689 [Pristionchus pacificus]
MRWPRATGMHCSHVEAGKRAKTRNHSSEPILRLHAPEYPMKCGRSSWVKNA